MHRTKQSRTQRKQTEKVKATPQNLGQQHDQLTTTYAPNPETKQNTKRNKRHTTHRRTQVIDDCLQGVTKSSRRPHRNSENDTAKLRTTTRSLTETGHPSTDCYTTSEQDQFVADESQAAITGRS